MITKKDIAHLDQPYQPGEPVKVWNEGSEEWMRGYLYIGKSHTPSVGNDAVCYVVEKSLHGGSLEYAYIIRPIKQPVQVTLDKKLEDKARFGAQNVGFYGNMSERDQQVLMARREVCEAVAIASQEGEDNE